MRWTRSDSNRRSSPCKGDAFPLGHGPSFAQGADERTRTSTPVRAIDPKSIASAIPPRRPSAPPSCGDQSLNKYSESYCFTQIRGGLVPPILSGHSLVAKVQNPSTCTVIYLSSLAPGMLTQTMLSHHLHGQSFFLAVCSLLGITQPHSHRCDEIIQ
jgi:hypothetical protein